MGEATYFWKSDPDLDTPDLQTCQGEVPFCSAETPAQFSPPAGSWTLLAGLVRPKSRGQMAAPRLFAPIKRGFQISWGYGCTNKGYFCARLGLDRIFGQNGTSKLPGDG
jgi:hypothetical protein